MTSEAITKGATIPGQPSEALAAAPAGTAPQPRRPMVPPRIERIGPLAEVTTQFVGQFSI